MTRRPNYVERYRVKLAELLPGCPPALLDLYTLLAIESGRETDAVMVHNAWSVWCNGSDPGHRSLIPFPFLTPEVQALDEPYVKAIHETVEAIYQADLAAHQAKQAAR